MATWSERSLHGFEFDDVAVTVMIITVLLGGIALWEQIVQVITPTVIDVLQPSDPVLVGGLLSGVLFLGGLGLVSMSYARFRGITPGSILQSPPDHALLAHAILVPIGFVSVTKLVGVITGVPYNALTMTAVATDPPIWPVLSILGLGLLVGVPSLVLICQILVQGSFDLVVDADTSVVLTTLVTGFLLLQYTGGLSIVPERGKLLGAAIFTLALGIGLLARGHWQRRILRRLAGLPVLLLSTVIVLSGIAAIDSIAGGLFVMTHFATLGVAAFTYDRTGSIVPPALSYATLLVANRSVVVIFEAGMQSW